jgi:hypothetical protein
MKRHDFIASGSTALAATAYSTDFPWRRGFSPNQCRRLRAIPQ